MIDRIEGKISSKQY